MYFSEKCLEEREAVLVSVRTRSDSRYIKWDVFCSIYRGL